MMMEIMSSVTMMMMMTVMTIMLSKMMMMTMTKELVDLVSINEEVGLLRGGSQSVVVPRSITKLMMRNTIRITMTMIIMEILMMMKTKMASYGQRYTPQVS